MMEIEKARNIANSKFHDLVQPVLDDKEELTSDEFVAKVKELKREIQEETGYEVETFYINPLGFGFFEITTTFTSGERLIKRPRFYPN